MSPRRWPVTALSGRLGVLAGVVEVVVFAEGEWAVEDVVAVRVGRVVLDAGDELAFQNLCHLQSASVGENWGHMSENTEPQPAFSGAGWKTLDRLRMVLAGLETAVRDVHLWFGGLDGFGWRAVAAMGRGMHRGRFRGMVTGLKKVFAECRFRGRSSDNSVRGNDSPRVEQLKQTTKHPSYGIHAPLH
jgi:hypothetical protein